MTEEQLCCKKHQYLPSKTYQMKPGIEPNLIDIKECKKCGDKVYYFTKGAKCPVCKKNIPDNHRLAYATTDLPKSILFECKSCCEKILGNALQVAFKTVFKKGAN